MKTIVSLSKPGGILLFLSLALACSGLLRQGDTFYRAGQPQQALDEYSKAYRESPGDPEVQFRMGLALLKVGQVGAAQPLLEKAVQAGGEDLPEARLALAEALTALRLEKDAMGVYRSVQGEGMTLALARNNMGVVLVRMGQAQGAEEAFLQAQTLRPGWPGVYLNLAVLEDQHLNRPARALGYYKCFLRLVGDTPYGARVQGRMSHIRHVSGAEAEDVTCAAQAESSSEDFDVWRLLWYTLGVYPQTEIGVSGEQPLAEAEAMYRAQRFSEVIDRLDQLQKAGRLSVKGHFLLGMAYLRAGDPFHAVPRLIKAVEQDPAQADYLFELGWAYEMADDEDSALEIWRKGQALFPQDPRFPDVLKDR